MGRRGRERCLHQFDINATAAEVETLYRTSLRELKRTRSCS